MNALIFALPGNENITECVSQKLAGILGAAVIRRFPDGESYICVESDPTGKTAIIVAALREPDDKFLQLIFLAATLKDLGAARVVLVAPYLAYMRQDRSFRSGEAITSVYFARLISEWFDGLVTIDPHLHRRSSLDEIYAIPSVVMSAAPIISEWIRRNVPNPLLVGPDGESEQWVKSVAEAANAPYLILEKIRLGDRDVEVSIPHVEKWIEKTPVLIDDIISTAHTMIQTVRHLKIAGLPAPVCIGIHAVFAGNAYEELLAAGASDIYTCDTIQHVSNSICVADLIVEGVKQMCEAL